MCAGIITNAECGMQGFAVQFAINSDRRSVFFDGRSLLIFLLTFFVGYGIIKL